jgi:hypothetical protein
MRLTADIDPVSPNIDYPLISNSKATPPSLGPSRCGKSLLSTSSRSKSSHHSQEISTLLEWALNSTTYLSLMINADLTRSEYSSETMGS